MCPKMCFSRTDCSLSRYNAKDKLNCFNCKTGVFLRLRTPMFTKKVITFHVFAKTKPAPLGGTINNYKEKLSVPRVQQQHHNASIQLNIDEQ